MTMSVGSQEEHDESMRRFRERREDERRRRAERPELTLADSLADRRAEEVIAWMRDSLDLSMKNEELPATAGQIRLPFMGNFDSGSDLEQKRTHATAAMRRGLVRTGNEGKAISHTPEERWYDRGVRLEFWTQAHLDMMMQVMGPR